ncbi:MAG: HEAT repeat domain-containing protein, partial [Geminicoccaceae bacterium]|nr:HEAT repeat domain-containing protein [Geminicoccaceae bacterium]
MIDKTNSSRARGRTIRALGFLGHHSAVEPLLKILESRKLAAMVRMDAAIALGLLGNTREIDPLYDLARDLNHYGTTKATFEFLSTHADAFSEPLVKAWVEQRIGISAESDASKVWRGRVG